MRSVRHGPGTFNYEESALRKEVLKSGITVDPQFSELLEPESR